MTSHFTPPAPEANAVTAILIDAARCRRHARDHGLSVQPSLARILLAHDYVILAPVLDSLCSFYEAALGRPMAVGRTLTPSDDERLLLGLLDGTRQRHCLACSNGLGTALDCAISSTRIMLALAIGRPVARTLQ